MTDVFYVIIHKLFLSDELFSSGVTAVVATILTISLVSTKVRSFIFIIVKKIVGFGRATIPCSARTRISRLISR